MSVCLFLHVGTANLSLCKLTLSDPAIGLRRHDAKRHVGTYFTVSCCYRYISNKLSEPYKAVDAYAMLGVMNIVD